MPKQKQRHQKAAIFDFDGRSLDDDGEVLLGFYWQLLDNSTEDPITELMGPYTNFNQCYAALDHAYQTGDY